MKYLNKVETFHTKYATRSRAFGGSIFGSKKGFLWFNWLIESLDQVCVEKHVGPWSLGGLTIGMCGRWDIGTCSWRERGWTTGWHIRPYVLRLIERETQNSFKASCSGFLLAVEPPYVSAVENPTPNMDFSIGPRDVAYLRCYYSRAYWNL